MKRISFIFLPEHLEKTFASVKVDLSVLDTFSADIGFNRELYSKDYYASERESDKVYGNEDDLYRYFKNKISVQDIVDFISFNQFINNRLFNSYCLHTSKFLEDLSYSGLMPYDHKPEENMIELLNMYVGKGGNGEFIINENNLNNVFSIVRKDNCIFVILKNGFSNLFTLNRVDLQKSFSNLLFGQLIKTYGEQALYTSGLLVRYLESLDR